MTVNGQNGCMAKAVKECCLLSVVMDTNWRESCHFQGRLRKNW